MKLMIDTNVILDVLLKREPFFTDSYRAIKLCNKKHTPCFSASSATDIFYLLRKALGAEKARKVLGDLLHLLNCVDTMHGDITNALLSDVSDFEDAVVDSVAVRIKAKMIITRNVKDFKDSKIPAVTPADFIALGSDGE